MYSVRRKYEAWDVRSFNASAEGKMVKHLHWALCPLLLFLACCVTLLGSYDQMFIHFDRAKKTS